MFPTADLFFDINAKLEEQKKGSSQVTLGFNIVISTKPSIVKYSVIGTATLDGPSAEIKKKLEPNAKTKIPQIMFAIYQDIFNSIYILASILNAPYPPPDLLHPMSEKIQILPSELPQTETSAEKTSAPEAAKATETAPPPVEAAPAQVVPTEPAKETAEPVTAQVAPTEEPKPAQ